MQSSFPKRLTSVPEAHGWPARKKIRNFP